MENLDGTKPPVTAVSDPLKKHQLIPHREQETFTAVEKCEEHLAKPLKGP